MDIPSGCLSFSEGFPGSRQVPLSEPCDRLTHSSLGLFAVGISSFQSVPGKVTFSFFFPPPVKLNLYKCSLQYGLHIAFIYCKNDGLPLRQQQLVHVWNYVFCPRKK